MNQLIVHDHIVINASAEKVWDVLTLSELYKQWDGLPESFSEERMSLGSIIEWEGYSKLTVTKFETNKHFKLSLYLPTVELKPSDYDVSYSFTLSPKNDQTLLTFEIGDFSPLPKGKDYYDASVEFARTAKKKIKELSEK